MAVKHAVCVRPFARCFCMHVGHQLDKSKGGIFTLADVHVRLSVTSSAHNLNGTLVRSSRLKKTKTHMLLTRKLYPAL